MKPLDELRALRLKNKLKQKDIAQILNVARTTYTKWETGEAEPNISALIKLADYFDVSVDTIIGHKTKAKSKSIKIVDNTVIYRYDGKTVKKVLKPEEMKLIASMLDSVEGTEEE